MAGREGGREGRREGGRGREREGGRGREREGGREREREGGRGEVSIYSHTTNWTRVVGRQFNTESKLLNARSSTRGT